MTEIVMEKQSGEDTQSEIIAPEKKRKSAVIISFFPNAGFGFTLRDMTPAGYKGFLGDIYSGNTDGYVGFDLPNRTVNGGAMPRGKGEILYSRFGVSIKECNELRNLVTAAGINESTNPSRYFNKPRGLDLFILTHKSPYQQHKLGEPATQGNPGIHNTFAEVFRRHRLDFASLAEPVVDNQGRQIFDKNRRLIMKQGIGYYVSVIDNCQPGSERYNEAFAKVEEYLKTQILVKDKKRKSILSDFSKIRRIRETEQGVQK